MEPQDFTSTAFNQMGFKSNWTSVISSYWVLRLVLAERWVLRKMTHTKDFKNFQINQN